MHYDLTELRNLPIARVNRIGHLIVGLSVLGIAGVGTYGFLSTYVARGGTGVSWPDSALVLALIAYIEGMLIFVFRLTSEGPRLLSVDRNGFVFQYQGNRKWGLGWTDPEFELRIFSSHSGPARQGSRSTQLVVSGPRPKNNYITPEARDALLRAADEAGLSIVTGIPARQGSTMTIIHRP